MSNENQYPVILIDDFYNFLCPHCDASVVVHKSELCCKIFRCGIIKSNGNQIPPHSNKEECDRLEANDLIHGCGKPFMIDGDIVKVCDYI